jgi:hypothetical protein
MSIKGSSMDKSRKNRINQGGLLEIKFRNPDQAQLDFEEVFMGLGSEEITAALITELSGRGWDAATLEGFRKRGFRYNRRRDSIIEGRLNSI